MSTLALATSPPTTEPARTMPDGARFEELLAAHDHQLRALALRILGDPGLVDDAVQEAYLRAYRALPRFRGESSLGTWLHRIVHNVCMDEHRRRRRRAEEPFDESAHEGEPAEAADLGVERSDLVAGLAGLPYGQRAAIVLVDGYGLDHAAVAHMLGVPVGTVGSRAFRARAVLRQALAAA